MSRKLCSIFLSPAPGDAAWASRLISDLAAAHGTIPFEPHLTLHSGVGDPLVAGEVLAAEAAALSPRRLRVRRIGATEEFFRSVFIEFQVEDRLLQLREVVKPLLEREKERPFLPHLSLLYAEMPLVRKEEIAAGVCVPPTLTFDRLKIVTLRDPDRGWGDFRGWETLREIPLSGVAGEAG
ncbi:MAG TPA: hypothetical protein VNX25_02665 [Verrucomicrobiae bacterium]|nr:hypothetical protein [Verrucomicrobiae bacterium]